MTISRVRWTLSLLAIAGTLPYLGLKLHWLSGGRVGLTDPDFGETTSMFVANLATFGLDLTAVALALASVMPFGRRLPGWLVLFPMWVGTGLLAPMVMIVPLQMVTGTGLASSEPSDGPIADWVYAMVYAGFIWQAVFLLAAFALYAHDRWGRALGWGAPLAGSPGVPASRRQRLSGVVAAAGLAGGGLALGVQATGPFAPPLPNLLGMAAFAVSAVVGLLLLALPVGLGIRRWVPVVLAWLGTGAMFSWALYLLLLLLVPIELVGDVAVSWADVVAEAVRVVAGAAAAVVMIRLLRRRSAAQTVAVGTCA